MTGYCGKCPFFATLITLFVTNLTKLPHQIYHLHFLGVDKCNSKVQECYYGLTEADVEWVRKHCNICNQAAPPKTKDLIVKPIIPTGMMDELVVDLIDFSKYTDEKMNWIMLMKLPFPKFIWTYPEEDKEAPTTGVHLES